VIRVKSAWVMLLSAVLLTAACESSAPPATAATGAPTESGTPTQSGTPSAQPSIAGVDVETGPGTFFLSDPRVGLDALASYTATLTVSFDGTAAGQARTWSSVSRLQHTAQPPASVLTIEVSGDAKIPEPAVVAEAAGAAYQLGADGTCASQPAEPENSILAFREPIAQLPGLVGAEAAGSEPLNGVAADHFTFDGRATLEAGAGTTTGEIWIAADGGHVLRFVRTTTADATYFGEGIAGTMTWEYVLDDINSLTSIALPAACQLGVPIMAGATNVIVLPLYVQFDTQSSIADIAAFYADQLTANGWAAGAEPFQGDDRAAIEFVKGSQSLYLLITPGENGRRVDLALSPSD
jgi:hypothetical protein